MKVILTIGGYSYLLPAGADPAVILKNISGAKRIEHQSHYGPEGERYKVGAFFDANVVANETSRIGLELVDDSGICTEKEWQAKVDAADKDLPKSV